MQKRPMFLREPTNRSHPVTRKHSLQHTAIQCNTMQRTKRCLSSKTIFMVEYRSLWQNMVSFIGLFCKRDLCLVFREICRNIALTTHCELLIHGDGDLYVYVCTCTCTCIYIHIYIYIHMHIDIYAHVSSP